MTINTNVCFHNYEDWADFLNFLLRNKLMSYNLMIDHEYIMVNRDSLDVELPEDYPPITADLINREVKLGNYHVWIEHSFDRFGNTNIHTIHHVPERPAIASNWVINAENAMTKDNRKEMEALGVDWI